MGDLLSGYYGQVFRAYDSRQTQRSGSMGKRRKRAQRIRGFANSGDSFRRGRFRRASGSPIFSLASDMEEKSAWTRLVHPVGAVQATPDF